MSKITVKDGTEIYYKDWGTGQPIFFHHGWPLSGDDWDAQMMFFLNEGFRVIAHDRRGHGRSTQTPNGHDMDTYAADSITSILKTPGHFYYANRLFLLNLAAIYTTGFECPDTSRVIPELKLMLPAVKDIYQSFNASFPSNSLSKVFLSQYDEMIKFVDRQPEIFSQFDRYSFIRNYVNPLFSLNQELIRQYRMFSKS